MWAALLLAAVAADENATNAPSHPSHSCDRPSAREARKAVSDVLVPLARSLGAELLHSCPLHPDHDRLLPHERKKKPMTQWQWRCDQCGKLFKSEHYIDMHMERKHQHLLSATALTCLGDFCDILRCPSWVRSRSTLATSPLSLPS